MKKEERKEAVMEQTMSKVPLYKLLVGYILFLLWICRP
ncbi:hypothetical protein SAMN05660206_105188 [Sphingobacterium wenxiniae]|uniref:Uncharacterized protein n=1 Tax=Sphingobacterium wenxiniae TaxID=683125 RepID=A0A1I6T0D3_9SPHI|nr:hypothetical protein SAMN05660206_105188 [Sphingobacterium wenxiniae]